MTRIPGAGFRAPGGDQEPIRTCLLVIFTRGMGVCWELGGGVLAVGLSGSQSQRADGGLPKLGQGEGRAGIVPWPSHMGMQSCPQAGSASLRQIRAAMAGMEA